MKWDTLQPNCFECWLGDEPGLHVSLWEGYQGEWHFITAFLISRCTIKARDATEAKGKAEAMLLAQLASLTKEVKG